MAVEFKSGDSTDIATVDPLSKAIRVTNYASDGHEGLHSFPIAVVTNNATQAGEFVLPSTNSEQYKFISMQLIGTWVGTVTFEGSNDNTTFYSIATTDPAANSTGAVFATANRIVKIPVLTKYIRARVSAYTSGTISANAFGHLDENSSGLVSTLGEITISGGPVETLHQVITAATKNETSVTTGATRLRTFSLVNGVATLRFVKLYDKASAPVAGTDTPIATITMSPNSESNFSLPGGGLNFSLGFAYAVTLGVANSDTTADSVVGAITGILGYTE